MMRRPNSSSSSNNNNYSNNNNNKATAHAFFFLVLSLLLLPTHIRAETQNIVVSVKEQSSQSTLHLEGIDPVLQNIAKQHRKLWNINNYFNDDDDDKMTQNNGNVTTMVSDDDERVMSRDEPWRHTDPTGVYGPLKDSHQVSKRDLPFIYQSPPTVPCRNAESTSIISGAKAVDFASFALGILTLVININNNINNNNNNNNNINLNAVDSSNIVANFNTNNANQVNIMPPGRRRRRSMTGSTALAIVAALQVINEGYARP